MIFETFMGFLSKIFCFTSYVNNKSSFPNPLSMEEERAYIERVKKGDSEAREILIRHNLRLVAHVVKKYSGAGEADDLIPVGTIGLIKGIESFDHTKGARLATYAARCVENAILSPATLRAERLHPKASNGLYGAF